MLQKENFIVHNLLFRVKFFKVGEDTESPSNREASTINRLERTPQLPCKPPMLGNPMEQNWHFEETQPEPPSKIQLDYMALIPPWLLSLQVTSG